MSLFFRLIGAVLVLSGISISAQAQYLTGGDPSAAPLKGCVVLNAVPTLNNGAPGSCANLGGSAGQFAGSAWAVTLRNDGSISSGHTWVLPATLQLGSSTSTAHLVFKAPFVKKPVCFSTNADRLNLNISTLIANVTTASLDLIYANPQSNNGPAREAFSIICSIGQ